jgi:hypothetical protein
MTFSLSTRYLPAVYALVSRTRHVCFSDATRYALAANSERWKLSTRVQRINDAEIMEEDAELARIGNVLRRSSRHSRLYQWMRKLHAKMAEQFAEDRPNWATLAIEFGAMELFDAKGQPPSAHVARRTWWQVRHDLATKAARKQAKTAAAVAGVQAVPPLTTVPAILSTQATRTLPSAVDQPSEPEFQVARLPTLIAPPASTPAPVPPAPVQPLRDPDVEIARLLGRPKLGSIPMPAVPEPEDE